MLCRAHIGDDSFHLADGAALHDFDQAADVRIGAFVAAGLQDSSMLANRLDHRLLIANGQSQRFFAINVLASPWLPEPS